MGHPHLCTRTLARPLGCPPALYNVASFAALLESLARNGLGKTGVVLGLDGWSSRAALTAATVDPMFKHYRKAYWSRIRRTVEEQLARRSTRSYPALVDLLHSFDGEHPGAEVLYLGDSVVRVIAREDQDRRSLGDMVRDELDQRYRVVTVSYDAYHLQIYYLLSVAVSRMQHPPKYLIIPLNLRSFSPQWDWSPRWQFESESEMLNRYIVNPLTMISPVHMPHDLSKRLHRFMHQPVDYPLSSFRQIGQFQRVAQEYARTDAQKRSRYAQLFIYHYTYPLASNHRKLEALQSLLDMVVKTDLRIVLYVTPINYDAGTMLVGSAFSQQVALNRAALMQIINPYQDNPNIQCLDASTLLGPECFLHPYSPTEHLNQPGRTRLAHLIATMVLK